MKLNITVVSLGPGDAGLLTLQAADKLRGAKHLVLRTGRHRAVAWLEEQAITFTTLDDMYDQYDDFDRMHAAMAKKLWMLSEEQGALTYAVIDAATDESVRALHRSRPKEGKLTILPGVSRADACLAALPEEQSGQVRILPAEDCMTAEHDPSMPLLITELWHPVLASQVKLWLTDVYDDEMTVMLYPSSAKMNRKPISIPLMDLDRQRTYDHTVSVYIPAAPLTSRKRYCFADLVRIMSILRGPGGCPWDREQTHETLRKYLIEEAYETVGAIDGGDPDEIADELGDVLLQIVFHADVAKAHQDFTISDVTTAICRKMIYRHAHIFGGDHCETAEDVSQNWERLKKAEKGLTTQASVLADVSQGLPALMRAAKVQKKAAQVGFDWDDAISALPKVSEEAAEVQAELEAQRDPAEELGDLLFSCVNVTRLCGLEPELVLKQATEKFIRRFTAMENAIISDGKPLEGLTLAEMDVYWNKVKQSAANQPD